MAVDATVPMGDKALMKVLVISEAGDLWSDAFGLADSMEVSYFQRLVGDIPHLFSEDSLLQQVTSWRPLVSAADIVIVDDPSYVSKIAKDFDLDSMTVFYKVNKRSHREVARMIHWLNPESADALKAAVESVDIESFEVEPPEVESGWVKRLLRRFRA